MKLTNKDFDYVWDMKPKEIKLNKDITWFRFQCNIWVKWDNTDPNTIVEDIKDTIFKYWCISWVVMYK